MTQTTQCPQGKQRTVATPDGRVLAVEEAGHPDGLPVLVHNGTPNSRHLYAPVVADAATVKVTDPPPATDWLAG